MSFLIVWHCDFPIVMQRILLLTNKLIWISSYAMFALLVPLALHFPINGYMFYIFGTRGLRTYGQSFTLGVCSLNMKQPSMFYP